MLELYHHGSSACAAKTRFTLEEKRIPWRGTVVDIFRGEQFKPEFLALNPKAVVPVLVHDGFVIPESTVICEYLEDAFPQHPVFPTRAEARAAVRLWTKAVDEELHPACSAITYVVSHRHTLLHNGVGSFEDFLKAGARKAPRHVSSNGNGFNTALRRPVRRIRFAFTMGILRKWSGRSAIPAGSSMIVFRWRTSPWPRM